MRSAFGVEHGQGMVFKAAGPPAGERDRKVRNTMAGISGTSAGLAGATGAIGYAEHKGKDPMGFVHTMEEYKGRKMTPKGKTKLLGTVARAHKTQAIGATGLALGAGGMAHAYHRRQKSALAKALTQKTKDRAATAGTVGVGGAAVGAGGFNAQYLARTAGQHQHSGRAAHHLVALHSMGEVGMSNKELATAKKTRRLAGRTVGLKGAGALASAGVAGLGGKAILDATKRPSATKKRA